jgi:hypothetical protein
MESFKNWLGTTPFASWFKVFVSAILSAWVVDLTGAAVVDFSNWETWVVTGLVAVLPVIVNWLNTADPRYGKGAAG